MVVNTTEKRRRCVLANHLGDKVPASRVLVHEVGNIVNKASDQNERPLGRLFLDWKAVSEMFLAEDGRRTHSYPKKQREVRYCPGPNEDLSGSLGDVSTASLVDLFEPRYLGKSEEASILNDGNIDYSGENKPSAGRPNQTSP